MACTEKQIEEFLQLFQREQRRLSLYVHSMLPNWTDVEEVMQNANLVLWRKFGGFEAGTDFYHWACRVAHFEVLKFLEKRQRERRLFSVEFVDHIGTQVLARSDALDRRRDALTHCLSSLREDDRRLILLRYADGASVQSVATQVGRSVKAVYGAINRIRDSLLQCVLRRLAREDHV